MRGQLQFWFLAVLLGCVGSLACTERGSSGASSPEACDLHVMGEKIQYKGNTLSLRTPVAAWERVLGPPSRQVETADISYIWDQAGIEVFAREPGGEISGLLVILIRPEVLPQEMSELWDGPPEYWPHSPFPGRLCVDGGQLSASTRIEDLNRAKQGQKFTMGVHYTSYDYYTSPSNFYVAIRLTDTKMRPRSFHMEVVDLPPPPRPPP